MPVQDIVIQLENPQIGENEKLALIQRLETVKDFCIKALNREQRKVDISKKPVVKKTVKSRKK